MSQGSYEPVANKKLPSRKGRLSRFVMTVIMLFISIQLTKVSAKTLMRFDIPAGFANKTLKLYAEQSDRQVLFPYDQMSNKKTNQVDGVYKADDALDILLRNTGLTVFSYADGTLTISSLELDEDKLNMKTNKTKRFFGSLTAIAALFAGNNAIAQESQTTTLEEVVVSGIRGSLQRAVDTKRNAEGVVDSISAEAIGKFPDANIAESLQRITGVSIDRTGGEGQSITVRGFGPSFNKVVINGRSLASESETRGFSFDTLASELVKGLDVYKTSVASLPSGGVGSTVNVRTAKPFDKPGFQAAGSIAASHEDLSGETSPDLSLLVSNTFDDDSFGVLFSLSHQEREARFDQAQTDQWIENPTVGNQIGGAAPRFAPQNFDQRVAFSERTRTNANLVLQFAPSDELTVTADALYSDYDIETNATSVGHWFTPNNYQNAVTDANGTVISFDQPSGQATDFHAKTNDRLTDTTSFGLNFDWQATENLNVNVDFWTSEANREANNGNNNNMVLGYLRGASYDNSAGNLLPTVTGFRAGNGEFGNYLDPSNPRAHVSIRGGQIGGSEIKDQLDEIKLNGVWDQGNDTGLVKIKFGVASSEEEREINRFDNTTSGVHAILAGYLDPSAVVTFNGQSISNFDIPDSVFSVFDAGSGFLSGISGSGAVPTQWLRVNDEELFDIFEAQTGISHDAVQTGASITVTEETTSAYVETDFSGTVSDMPYDVTVGLRYEKTDVAVNGTVVPLEGLTIIDETEFGRVFRGSTPVTEKSDYDLFLPSISAKFDVSDNWVARAGISRTATRPTLASLAPAVNIITTRPGGNLTARLGNSALKPFESDNLDLSLEYYYGDSNYASIGWFQKKVKNFIVDGASSTTFTNSAGAVITDPLTGGPATFTVTSPTNAETATVDGFELAVQHNFDNGFGVIFNTTLVDSDAELDVFNTAQTFALPGLSDTLNLVGFYENGPYQVRLAYNQRDTFLKALSQSAGAEEPVFVDEYEQWDLSASYDINDQMTVFFEAINLTEEEVVERGRFENQLLNVDVTGRRFKLGVRGNF